MKRLFALMAVVLAVVSCQKDVDNLDVNVGGEQLVNITVGLPEATRAASGSGFDLNSLVGSNYELRYILEIYVDDSNSTKCIRKEAFTNTTGAVVFPVRLVPERDYRVVAWADIVPAVANRTAEGDYDYYYETSDGLDQVTIIEDANNNIKWNAMDEYRDAYTAFDVVEDFTANTAIDLVLKRPFAKVRVVSTDIKDIEDLGFQLKNGTVNYTVDLNRTYNALNGTSSNEGAKVHAFTYPTPYAEAQDDYETETRRTLFADYIFVSDIKEQDAVQFTLEVKDQAGRRIKLNNFNTDIALHANTLTTIIGEVLTEGGNVQIEINGELNEVEKYTVVSSASHLLNIINAGGDFMLGNHIIITADDVNEAQGIITRAAGEAKTTTINLNGYTITLEADVEVKETTTLIIDNQPLNETGGDKGAIVSNGGKIVNNGSLNIEGGHFGENTIENNSGEVNITGGTFESNPSSDFVDDDYIVVEGEDGEFTLEQKEEAVEINGTKYRSIKKAVAAAQNGETVKFILDVEQADGVIITDKNITIDLGGNTFTVTEGANTNNRNFKVNGSSVVTIKNGTMVAAGEYSSGAYGTLRTDGTANVTLNDVKLYNYRGNGFNVKACAGTNVTITDAEVYSQYGGGVEAAGGTVVLNDVTIDQKGVYSGSAWNSVAIGVNGNGKVTVNSGNYSASAISTDANAAQGTWVAYVMSSGGTLDIKGGTFNGVVAETAAAANACGLICADTKAIVNIYGGTFSSNGAILDMRNNTGGTPNPSATLYAGTFSADPRVSGLYSSNLITLDSKSDIKEENGKWVVFVRPVAKIGDVEYETLEAAVAAAKAGNTITLVEDVTLAEELEIPAGITLNGNGKQINGTIYAGGNLTFTGHTKVTAFSASYYNRVITIGEGACLEVTGTGRVTLGYGNIFNITGSIENAKTADKANIQPSLIIPGGISITGGNDATMNVTNAYVKIGSTTSKPGVANGKFAWNFDNAIVEFTKEFGFYDPTGGVNPTFIMDIKDSVFTTGTKIFVTKNSEVNVNNSVVTLGSYLANRGKLNLTNGSEMTGATIQFGENGGNDGAITVDNSSFSINCGNSTGSAFDGKGKGSITATNGATVAVQYYKDMAINVDATSTFTGTEVK